MVKKEDNRRLKKGLDSIFGSDVGALLEEIQDNKETVKQVELNIEELRPNPYQPRKTFDEKALKELSSSIKEHGIFTALIVRKSIAGYEIIAGERRFRAAKLAGLKTVPCVIVEFNDEQMMEISILENIQRENLNSIEEAIAYKSLIDNLGYTQEQLAKRVGKSREYCANLLRLLKLPVDVRSMIVSNKLSSSSARPLLSLDSEDLMSEIAEKVVKEKLSVREIEKLVKEYKNKKTSAKKSKEIDPNLKYVEDLIKSKLSTNASVDNKQIIIKYEGVEDLNRILDILKLID